MIDAQWVVLPALATGFYHWMRWVGDDQAARWEAEDPARTFASLAPYVVLGNRRAELQAKHEAMRDRDQALAQSWANVARQPQGQAQAQWDQAVLIQQRRSGSAGTLANFGLLGALAPGTLVRLPPGVTCLQAFPPSPGGPT